ncbi:MAG: hypothetical protein JOY82_14340 [Streptosporangiaceae bacterium]|nr:hypothetical protein [Streptosporangiaceae bacterium]
MSTTTTRETGRAGGQQAERIGRASFGLVMMLIIQFVLGTAYGLYGTAPTARKSIGIFSSPLLAVHVVFGILLILAAIDLLVRAIRAKIQVAVITSVTGLLSIIAAAAAGSAFTRDGAIGASMGMAVATAVALACYAINLRALGGRGSERA